MQGSDETPPPDQFAGVGTATGLLWEILKSNEAFRTHLGAALSVNPTDLAAFQVLMAEGAISPTTLAHRLGLTTAAATTVVDRLVKLDHVSRAPNITDRRGIHVVPNPKSVASAFEVLRPLVENIDAVMAEFPPVAQQAITDYLDAVVAAYRDALTEPTPNPDRPAG